GAPRARGHDATAVACKEDRVDQFGFAARELGNERDHDLAGSQLCLGVPQPLCNALIQQLVLVQPAGEPLEAVREIASPSAMLVELLIKGSGQWDKCKDNLQNIASARL